jgi:hypothetical protein
MATNRLPPQYRDQTKNEQQYVENVVLFAKRLKELQGVIDRRADDIFIEEDGTYLDLEEKAHEVRLLASFAGLLAVTAKKLDVEVSETGASFHKRGTVNEVLKRQLKAGMDQKLIEEIGGNYYDGDASNFLKQVRAFTTELRQQYKLPVKGKNNPPERSR